MSKSRKRLVIVLMVLGSVFVFISFFAKLEHWRNDVYITLALCGVVLATISLVLVMRKPEL